jgi:sulfur relay (sulfurtransferase) DsrF/TusC family protein
LVLEGEKKMVESVVIICEDGPFGKNSVVESIRMAAGLLAVGDIDNCKVILLKDAVYFMHKNLNPGALNMDKLTNIMRLIELSELEIFLHDVALKIAGIESSDLVLTDNLKIIGTQEISQLILDADMSFKY